MAIEEVDKSIPPPITPQTPQSNKNMLAILRSNAIRAFNLKYWTTPPYDNVVLWTSKMLEIDPQNTFAKEMLEKVIDEYLKLYGGGRLQQLRQKLDTPVLKKKLKDYANSNQRQQITLLLGPAFIKKNNP